MDAVAVICIGVYPDVWTLGFSVYVSVRCYVRLEVPGGRVDSLYFALTYSDHYEAGVVGAVYVPVKAKRAWVDSFGAAKLIGYLTCAVTYGDLGFAH